jgi:hypothetical protein
VSTDADADADETASEEEEEEEEEGRSSGGLPARSKGDRWCFVTPDLFSSLRENFVREYTLFEEFTGTVEESAGLILYSADNDSTNKLAEHESSTQDKPKKPSTGGKFELEFLSASRDSLKFPLQLIVRGPRNT